MSDIPTEIPEFGVLEPSYYRLPSGGVAYATGDIPDGAEPLTAKAAEKAIVKFNNDRAAAIAEAASG